MMSCSTWYKWKRREIKTSTMNLIRNGIMYWTEVCWSVSSSSQLASVSWWHVHSRAVVVQNLHRGQRDTLICPLISYRSLLCTLYCCYVPRVLLYFPPSIFSPVPFCCCRLRFLRPLHINYHLLQPPHPYPPPHCTLPNPHTFLTVIA